jgi:hypothetical protein
MSPPNGERLVGGIVVLVYYSIMGFVFRLLILAVALVVADKIFFDGRYMSQVVVTVQEFGYKIDREINLVLRRAGL